LWFSWSFVVITGSVVVLYLLMRLLTLLDKYDRIADQHGRSERNGFEG